MSKYIALMRFLLICYDSDIVLLCDLPIRERILFLIVRIRKHLNDTRGEVKVPKQVLMALAFGLLPEIIEYYETEEGQREFAEWKAEREAAERQNKQTTPKARKNGTQQAKKK